MLRELNKTTDITNILWFLHCSFYLYFIEKPIKCASENILLQKIKVLGAIKRTSLFEKKRRIKRAKILWSGESFQKNLPDTRNKQYKQAQEWWKKVDNARNLYEKKARIKTKGSVVQRFDQELSSNFRVLRAFRFCVINRGFFFICFILIWLFNSSRKMHMSNYG